MQNGQFDRVALREFQAFETASRKEPVLRERQVLAGSGKPMSVNVGGSPRPKSARRHPNETSGNRFPIIRMG